MVGMDNYLYVIGGMWYDNTVVNGLFRPTSSSVRFHTIRQQWERIANMQCARYSACGVAARGKIFIAGGVIGDGLLRDKGALDPDVVTGTCEMYNASTNEWQHIASLQIPRWQGSMVYLKGSLYIVGGYRCSKDHIPTSTLVVEGYDFESNAWKPKTKIPILSRDATSKRNNINACTLIVGGQVLTRPITRFQSFKGRVVRSTV